MSKHIQRTKHLKSIMSIFLCLILFMGVNTVTGMGKIDALQKEREYLNPSVKEIYGEVGGVLDLQIQKITGLSLENVTDKVEIKSTEEITVDKNNNLTFKKEGSGEIMVTYNSLTVEIPYTIFNASSTPVNESNNLVSVSFKITDRQGQPLDNIQLMVGRDNELITPRGGNINLPLSEGMYPVYLVVNRQGYKGFRILDLNVSSAGYVTGNHSNVTVNGNVIRVNADKQMFN